MPSPLIVDRIEGDFALIEMGGAHFEIPLRALPISVKEGDIIQIQIGRKDTENMKKAMERLQRLSERDDENDIIDL